MPLVRHLTTLSLYAALLAGSGAFAQRYNSRTGEIEMPGSPIAPTSPLQCDQLASQWQSLQQQLDAAHQSCLDAHQREPENPGASNDPKDPICSHSECQSLHANRLQMIANGTQAVSACRNQVQIRQRFAAQRIQEPQFATSMPSVPEPVVPSATQTQELPDRTKATQTIARSLENNASDLRELVAQQEARYALLQTDAPNGNEIPAIPDSAESSAGPSLAPGSNTFFQGNPPDSLVDSWQAGVTVPVGVSGDYDRRLYVWQYVRDDAAQCPAATLSGVTLSLQALFEEVAVVHYHVTNGLIDRSVIDKDLHFLRCIPAGNPSYPMYRALPRLNTNAAAVGVRG
jgi:hypothetical protein